MSHKILILIPARYQSSRFPGKPLSKILGKSMIQRVFENLSALEATVAVVTDDQRIEDEVLSFNGKVIRVDDDVISGTERIHLGYTRFFNHQSFDLIVNVQGDEPLIKAEVIDDLVNFHLSSNFDMGTVVRRRNDNDDHQNPNCVKVQFSPITGQCLCFSRASVPFARNASEFKDWFQHIGIYSFKPKALEKFSSLEPSYLELVEGLEQLRALENGLTIGAVEKDIDLIGVDSPDDIKKVEEKLSE